MAKVRGFRRVARAMWSAPNDPQIYGALEIEAVEALRFIDAARHAGHRITATHLVGRAVARALQAVPDLNVRIVGDRALPRPGIDIFFITAVSGGRDLSGVKVEHVDRLGAVQLAAALNEQARRLRAEEDPGFARSKRIMDKLPTPALRALLHLSAFATQTLQLDLPRLGLRRSPFGSAMITSVGMFGVPQGFAPLAWMYDVPLLVLVGEITERALVVDHQVVARPVIPLTATLDHRYVDGWHAAQAMQAVRAYLANPAAFEPPFGER
jgi:pyruvate dehydrogenase E2 component (dihydrolipoamide acetyltransferase)